SATPGTVTIRVGSRAGRAPDRAAVGAQVRSRAADDLVVDLLPNSLSFRVITTIDVEAESEIPDGFTGRVRLSIGGVLIFVAWFTDGLLDDPARRMPAYTRYRENGRV